MDYKKFLPEWTPIDGILMALPHEETDWNYILESAYEQYREIISKFTAEGLHVVLLCDNPDTAVNVIGNAANDKVSFIKADYNDTWTRDYGPITILKHNDLRVIDFGFNGWGLKFAADKDNLVNRQLHSKAVITKGLYRNESDFILEGGSIDTDGEGTVLTTTRCLCSPNRNGGLSKPAVIEKLKKHLGAQHVLMLDHGALIGDDTDSHIDTLARMAPENTIVYTGCRNIDDPQFEELLRMRAQLSMFRNIHGDPFNLVELPLPDPVYDDEGNRLPATYANYLVTDRHVFMPTYNQPFNDSLAMQTIKIPFPHHKVIGIDCITLLWQHGSLHCATMQLPEGIFSPVIFD